MSSKILTHYRPAISGTEKNILEDLSSSVFSQFKEVSILWKPELY